MSTNTKRLLISFVTKLYLNYSTSYRKYYWVGLRWGRKAMRFPLLIYYRIRVISVCHIVASHIQLKKILEKRTEIYGKRKINLPGNDYILAFPAWHLYFPSKTRKPVWQLSFFLLLQFKGSHTSAINKLSPKWYKHLG